MAKPSPRNKLTEKEKKFVREYALKGHGTHAAIVAGYAPRSAHVTASQLLKKPKIQKAIEKLNEKAEEKAAITKAQVAEMYLKASTIAEDTQQPSAINGAAKGLAALFGLEEPHKSKVEHEGGVTINVVTGVNEPSTDN